MREQFTASTRPRRRGAEYGRRGAVELFAATAPLRGWRGLRVEAAHRAAAWVQFVARLMDTTCRDAKKGRWVMDHLSTPQLSFCYAHFPPAVAQAGLQRREIVCTPAPGSGLNTAGIESSVARPSASRSPRPSRCAKWSTSGKRARMRGPNPATGNSKRPMPASNQLNHPRLFNFFNQ